MPIVLPLFAKAFLTLFVVIDPVGLAPLYLALVSDRTEAEQSQIATRAVVVSAVILLVFGLTGAYVLHNLGISLQAFQIAAGFLLFKIALDMIFVQQERETEAEVEEAETKQDVSVFPLAIPLIAGPGSLASILVLSRESSNYYLGLSVVLAAAAAVLVLCYLFLLLSRPLAKVLGQIGINVVTRVLGVLLAALAVQYMLDGLLSLLQLPPAQAFGLDTPASGS
ncbi:MarC family protein [Nodosilinea sp. E11]|uniref:MarC family protein n=1 Tax=Nodosilinea sp. E11 TaxID=3037479 RepID=UPI0029341817|nr:MarC family protein [Nodosilinea sp. E11]WOD40433.1 MarC family protein [Nodosilinea sp. E11]